MSIDIPWEPSKVIGMGRAYRWGYPEEKVPEPLPEPLVFLKPITSLARKGEPVEAPRGSECECELELAVVVGKGGKNITLKDAMSHVGGYALAMDMCARSVLVHGRKEGRPWAIPKGFDSFAPIGNFIKAEQIQDPHQLNLKLQIDGKETVDEWTSNMIYSVAQMIAFVSSMFTLVPGDIILTGAAKGVSLVEPGSTLSASLATAQGEILDEMKVEVITRQGGYEWGKHWLEWLQ